MGVWWTVLIKYFVPGVLIVILGGDLIHDAGSPYENYSWKALVFIGADWLVITLLIALVLSGMPGRQHFKSGPSPGD